MIFSRLFLIFILLLGAGAMRTHAQATPAPAEPPPSTSVPVPEPPPVAGTTLTWEDCVRLATGHNPDMESSRDAVLNSEAVKMGAYSALYPQISASLSGSRTYTGPGLGAPSIYANEFSEQITLSQTIFNGFLTKGNIDQARAGLMLAFANLDAQKAVTSFNLKSAFAQLLYAQNLVVISRNVIDIRQNNAHLVKLLYESGNEDKGAWLLSEANLDQARVQLNQAERDVSVSGLQLETYIGQALKEPVLATGTLETGPLPTEPDYRALAVQTPAYFQKHAEVDATAAGITIAQSGFYPTVSVDAAAGRSGLYFLPSQNGVSAGFSVSYPIFEGGQTYFNVRGARASLMEAFAALRSGTDMAALTLAQTFKSFVDAVDNRRIQQELLDASALRYRIAEAQYRNGLISFQDFNDITDTYVDQQETCLAAQRDAVIAESNWEQARGIGAIP